MRAAIVFLVAMLTLVSSGAMAACTMNPSDIVYKAPYFGTRMKPVEAHSREGSLVFSHVDDPRVIVNFTMASADPVGNVSRSEHVAELESYANTLVERAESEGRWAQRAIFPYDPVAWRIVEETTVEGVGEATVGHMEIRVTPRCILVADFISPSSVNLRQRWIQMATEIANIRDAASSVVVPERWKPEDTTPRGKVAILGGFLSPVVVTVILYMLLGNLRRLDPPAMTTRVILLSAAAVALGTVAYQHAFYQEALPQGKYIDNLFLLGGAGAAALVGSVVLVQQTALFGLVAASIAGFTFVAASLIGWTPDGVIGIAVGCSLMFMGGFGFYAWNQSSARTPAKS